MEVLDLTVILLSPQKLTQVECTILFVDEEDRGSMSRARLADEPVVEVLIDKVQSEANIAQYPVNQQIIAGEPNVS